MKDFTAILSSTIVASSINGVAVTNGLHNITGTELLHKLKSIEIGNKDGSHFLRNGLNTDDSGQCLRRSNDSTLSTANLLILDCDKRIDVNGEMLEGAPDPHEIHRILRENNIPHLLYGSYSHYTGEKGNRYRIVIPTNRPYTKEQLPSTVEATITLINSNLSSELLAHATENNSWSQPWYYPRRAAHSTIEHLYLEHLNGEAIAVIEPFVLPTTTNVNKPQNIRIKDGEISPISAFNEQYPLTELLTQYGYKKVYQTSEFQKWLSPKSTSGKPGITVKENRFFSHHDDTFHDGYSHSAFDLMRGCEDLFQNEAIKKAAKMTLAPDGRTVDEHNKSLARNFAKDRKDALLPSILHTEILGHLLKKIKPVDFRKTANLVDENEKLKSYHFHVIIIETILELAKNHHWGICRNHDFIYLYNGAYWSLIETDEIKTFLGEAAEKMGIDMYMARSFNFKEQLYKQFLASAHLPKPEQPKDVIFVNLKNGTFEVTPTNARLKPFNCDDFITYQLPFEYNPHAKAPLFEEYLNKVLPNIDLQNILAEYLGYVFIRPTTLKLEKTLLLYGKGANGKSVFYEIVRNLFGKQNTSEYSLQTLTNDSGYQRAMIANKLINYASEINGKLEASIFKQLVSGEPVEARLPYGNPFIMADYAKLIFNCNDLPKDVEQTEAYFRRFLIIPFVITIPEHEQDKELASKIINNELSGIFNWVLSGLKRLVSQKKFTDSEVTRLAREQYEKESDSVRLFIDETEYQPSSKGYTSLKALFQEYREFCNDDGFKPVNKTNFKKRLERFGILIEKKNIGKVVFVIKL